MTQPQNQPQNQAQAQTQNDPWPNPKPGKTGGTGFQHQDSGEDRKNQKKPEKPPKPNALWLLEALLGGSKTQTPRLHETLIRDIPAALSYTRGPHPPQARERERERERGAWEVAGHTVLKLSGASGELLLLFLETNFFYCVRFFDARACAHLYSFLR